MSPVLPGNGVSDFLINVFSVGFGGVEVSFVDVSNCGQVSDNSAGDFFVSSVLFVSSDLDLEVLCFQVSQ